MMDGKVVLEFVCEGYTVYEECIGMMQMQPTMQTNES